MPLHWPDSAQARSDLAECRAALRAGSKSFSSAASLLPKNVRDAATALYAFCREADDTIDLHAGGVGGIAELGERLDRIYAVTPKDSPVDRALCAVVEQYAIPRTLFDALLQGFAWDASGRRYETLAEVLDYAARVAGTVGAMMALLMGVRDRQIVACACDLGMAMQLTNIARDVGEDARAGRLYLPTNSLRYVGIDPDAWLAQPRMSRALRIVIDDLLCHADYLYSGVEAGIARLPRSCHAGITAAKLIYADIGRVVRESGCDSVSQRAVVSKSRKCKLLVKAFLSVPRVRSNDGLPSRPSTRHLLDSVEVCKNTISALDVSLPWWQVRSRALWLIGLFERLERRSRFDAGRAERTGALSS